MAQQPKRANGRPVDLSGAALSDQQALEVQAQLELQLGARCRGCGRRIAQGFRFTSVAPRDAQRPVLVISACSREDCGFADLAKQGATCVEMIEFAWLDELGLDAPPMVHGRIGSPSG